MAFFDEFSFTAFAASDRNNVSGVLVLDKIVADTNSPHAALFDCSLTQARELAFSEDRISSVTIEQTGAKRSIFLGQWGAVLAYGPSGIITLPKIGDLRGPMMRIRALYGSHYAVGAATQVFVSSDLDVGWNPIGPKLKDEARLTTFTDIDGFSSDEFYVAGAQGTIWRYERGVWDLVSCATNLAFHAIHCAEDGYVYACGQMGLLARGRGDKFELLSPESDPAVDLWGVAMFDGKLFCSGFRALLEYSDDCLQPHMPAMQRSAYFYALQACDGVLWSCGEKSLLRYDGSQWDATHDLAWVPPEN